MSKAQTWPDKRDEKAEEAISWPSAGGVDRFRRS